MTGNLLDQVSELRSFDTATLFESSSLASSIDPDLRPISPGLKIVGPALTVACPPGDNLMLHAAVAGAQPGEVLVVQCHDHTFGVWGEVLMTSAMAHGIAGMIIDGSVRDVDSMRAAGFPVFARGFALRGAAKRRLGLLRQPISCGGALVHPGDIVVADDSGIVVLEPATLEETLARARRRRDDESQMMNALRAKETTIDLLNLRHYLVVPEDRK